MTTGMGQFRAAVSSVRGSDRWLCFGSELAIFKAFPAPYPPRSAPGWSHSVPQADFRTFFRKSDWRFECSPTACSQETRRAKTNSR
jgi:hypothetical protein